MTTKNNTKNDAPKNEAPEQEAPKQEEETKMTPFDMCKEMHAKKMSEDDILTALSQHAGLSIMKAVSAYKNFLKKAGLVESKADRLVHINEIVEGFVTLGEGEDEEGNDVLDTIDFKGAVDKVMDDMDIGAQSARKHVKAYCKTNDIEIPVFERGTPATPEQTKYIVDARQHKDQPAKAQIIAAFITKWPDTSENRAKSIYAKASKDAGLTSSIATYSMDDVVKWAKGQDFEDDKALLAGFNVKFPEYSVHYAKKMVHMIRFAKVYCEA